MSLFTPELYRNFGIGFLAGTLMIALSNGGEIVGAIAGIV